jgi:hypothetical protein
VIPELPAAVPEIPVSDVVAATAYYRDKVDFTVDRLDAELALGPRAWHHSLPPGVRRIVAAGLQR